MQKPSHPRERLEGLRVTEWERRRGRQAVINSSPAYYMIRRLVEGLSFVVDPDDIDPEVVLKAEVLPRAFGVLGVPACLGGIRNQGIKEHRSGG
jgi:hypothetical protein